MDGRNRRVAFQAKKSMRGRTLEKAIVDAERKLEQKKKDLLKVKKKHKELAGQFIDLWVEVQQLKKQKRQ
ncbi:MAG: hypothetical protein MUC38_11300 [Cyclobacteriaceae bacterium]|jgi:hypothetical protein|nr:hypothetical protein [Cyclobacteriaceae bacterium]